MSLLLCVLQWHHWRTSCYCCGRSKATSNCILCVICKTTSHSEFLLHTLCFPQWQFVSCNLNNLFLYLYFVGSLITAIRFDLPMPNQMDTCLPSLSPKAHTRSSALQTLLATCTPSAGFCGGATMEGNTLWVCVLVIHPMAEMRTAQNILFLRTASERKTYLNKKRRENYCLGKED